MSDTAAVEACYRAIIDAWNSGNAAAFAEQFLEQGGLIGYDGSASNGRDEIRAHLEPIFKDHKPGRFVTIIRAVDAFGTDVAMLRAAVGVIPNGQTDIKPEVNFLQTMVAVKMSAGWRAAFLQATPAQFHGRPEMSAKLTEELRQAAARG